MPEQCLNAFKPAPGRGASALGWACVILAALMCLTACSGKKEDPQGARGPTPVGVMTVTTEPLTLTQELSGRTSAVLVAEVRPQVSGVVRARNFTEGGLVAQGQSLYQIDPAPYQAALDAAQAARASAEAAVASARLKASRAEQLVTVQAISQQEADDARTVLASAEAALGIQTAAVDTARLNLGYTRVVSPISGRIGRSSVTPGALVTANQTTALATVSDLSRIYVDITQSSADILRLRRQTSEGSLSAPDTAEVTLTLDDGSEFPLRGRLEFSEATVDPSTGMVTLRAIFPNPDGVLLPGMFVRARLAKGRVEQGIKVPQSAVSLNARGEASVLIAGPDGKAIARPVTLGPMIGRDWAIMSGLAPNDQVIVEGAMRLRPGSPVKPYAAPPRSGAETAAAGAR